MIPKIDAWHKTTIGYATFALLELGLTYSLLGLAINRGNILYYLLAGLFLIGTFQNVFKLIGGVKHVR